MKKAKMQADKAWEFKKVQTAYEHFLPMIKITRRTDSTRYMEITEAEFEAIKQIVLEGCPAPDLLQTCRSLLAIVCMQEIERCKELPPGSHKYQKEIKAAEAIIEKAKL